MTDEQTRFRLAIPLRDAFEFAMGWSDLGYASANDSMRHVMGVLVVDSLEYSEQWHASGESSRLFGGEVAGLFFILNCPRK